MYIEPGSAIASSAAARARRAPAREVGWRALALGLKGEARVGAPVAGDRARDVVVGEHPGRGRVDRRVGGERRLDRLPHRTRLPRARQEVEVEGRVQLVRTQVAREPLGVGHPDLADQDPRLLVGVGDRAPPAIDLVQLVAVDEGMLAGAASGRLLGQVGVLDQQRGRVDPYAGDAALEPEAQDVLVLGPDVGVLPVEVGLLGREQVQVPLAVLGARPGGAAEDRLPAVGWQLAVLAPPGRNQKRSRAGEPGGEASASVNQGCSLEMWFGTMSTIVRMPSSRASAISRSASHSVPKAGSIER